MCALLRIFCQLYFFIPYWNICWINLANSDLFAGLIRKIVAYLPDKIGQIVSICRINQLEQVLRILYNGIKG